MVPPIRQQQSGFTLLELIISMGIFGLLMAVTVWDFRTSGQANELRQNAVVFAQNLRRVQTLSQSGGTVTVCTEAPGNVVCDLASPPVGCTCSKVVPPGGFGVHVGGAGATEYSLFADMDEDKAFSSAADVTVNDGTITLDRKISFCRVTANDITFIPLRGAVSGSGTYEYHLQHNAINNSFPKVTVNQASGQVQEESSAACP